MAERTPWTTDGYNVFVPADEGRQELVAEVYSKEWAALVVKAVNHHDALVAALREMAAIADATITCRAPEQTLASATCLRELRASTDKTRAVLAALEGDASD